MLVTLTEPNPIRRIPTIVMPFREDSSGGSRPNPSGQPVRRSTAARVASARRSAAWLAWEWRAISSLTHDGRFQTAQRRADQIAPLAVHQGDRLRGELGLRVVAHDPHGEKSNSSPEQAAATADDSMSTTSAPVVDRNSALAAAESAPHRP